MPRVHALLACGVVGAFAAASCLGAQFNFTGTGAIPDGTSITPGSFGSPRSLTVTSNLDNPIAGVTLSLSVNHSFVGDLRVVLKYQPDDGSGSTVTSTVFERTGALNAADGGDSTNVNGTYVFVFGATTLWEAAAPLSGTATVPSGMYGSFLNPLTGTFTPVDYALPFKRLTGRGTWTLEVSDGATFDTGTVNGASINIIAQAPACFADFNNDGVVNTADLTFFLGRYTQPCP